MKTRQILLVIFTYSLLVLSPSSAPVSHAELPFSAAGMSSRPPIVLVHGWQGAHLGLPCQRQSEEYMDNGWEYVDEDLSSGDSVEEPAGSGNIRSRAGLGYPVEIALLYSGGAITASGPQDPDWHCTPVVEENVPYLIEAIDAAKAATGQPKVILIAHSMGGLVSRAYLESSQYRDDVVALYTLGTPHVGVPVDVLQAWVEFFTGIFGYTLEEYCLAQPVVCQFADDENDPGFPAGTTGIETFNSIHNQRAPGVYYHLLGADAPFSERGWFGAFIDALLTGPDDGIVPLPSALGQTSADGRLPPLSGPIDRLFINPTLHIPFFADDPDCLLDSPQRQYTFHSQDEWVENICFVDSLKRYIPSKAFLECLAPTLDGRAAGHTCGTVGDLAGQAAQPALRPSRLPTRAFTLEKGARIERIFWLEGGEAVLAAHAGFQPPDGTRLAFTLISPGGQVIDPASSQDLVLNITDTAALYWLTDAAPGPWQLIVQADNLAEDGLTIFTSGMAAGSVGIQASLDQPFYAPGSSAALSVRLAGAETASLSAQLSSGAGPQSLALSPAGAGEFTGDLRLPTRSGYSQITLLASGIAENGRPFEISKIILVPIAPENFRLNGKYSPARLGGELTVSIGIHASQSGTAGVAADLVDESGQVAARANNFGPMKAGENELELRFRGVVGGMYSLENVRLVDYSAGGVIVMAEQSPFIFQAPDAVPAKPDTATLSNPAGSGSGQLTCASDQPGPYQPGQTINLSFTYTQTGGAAAPEWLDSFFVDAPDAWQVAAQSAPLPDASGWGRTTAAIACDRGLATWGLQNPDLFPLGDVCELGLSSLPSGGSFYGPWAQTGTRDVFSENFESAFPPPGWEMIRTGGDNDNLGFRLTAARAHSGTSSAWHDSHDVCFLCSKPESWLVTPRLEIHAGDRLAFWQYLESASAYDLRAIFVSTGSRDPADGDFEMLAELGPGSEGQWEQISLDLSDYAGRDDVSIAFYYTGDAADRWFIDDVAVQRDVLTETAFTFEASYQVNADPANSCPGSPIVGLSSDVNDPRSGLAGVALGDLVVQGITVAGCDVEQACQLPAVRLIQTASMNGVCPGSNTIMLPEHDQEVTYCFEIQNTGPVTVTDYILDAPAIGINNLSLQGINLPAGERGLIFQADFHYTGQVGQCFTPGANVTAFTPAGLGQPQGAGADSPFVETEYRAAHTAPPGTTSVCIVNTIFLPIVGQAALDD